MLSGCSAEIGKKKKSLMWWVGRVDVLTSCVSKEVLEIYFAPGTCRQGVFPFFKESCRGKNGKGRDRNKS